MQFKKEMDNINNNFSFNLNNISRLLANEYYTIKKTVKKEKKIIKLEKKNEDFFIPKEKDSIFWCWIIFLYGLGEYEILRQTVFTSEKTYKINFVDKLKKINHCLKI